MKFRIIWSPRSEEEFSNILTYLESEFGISSALSCLENVEMMLEEIRKN